MFRSMLLLLTLVLLLSPDVGTAEPLPGIDDPTLSAAAELWLTEDSPIDALREIGKLAASGNVAAQFFANRVFLNLPQLDQEFGSLSRAEQLTVFPATPQDDRDRRFQPYEIDEEHEPALMARREITSALRPEDWIAQAEIMLAAGLRQDALDFFRFEVANRRVFDVEVLEFATDHLTVADPQIAEYWGPLVGELLQREVLGANEEHLSRWSEGPSELLRRSGFYNAVESGVWAALIAGIFASDELAELERFDGRNLVVARRLFEAVVTQDAFNVADHTEDIDELGRLMRGNVEQTPYLQPLDRLCSTVCPNDQSQCLVAGVLNNFDYSHVARIVEPVITAEMYYTSSRAVDEVLWRIAASIDGHMFHQALLPQCLIDAAR